MPDIYRVRTAITGGPGGDGLSTMWFDATGGLTAQNAANAVRTFWSSMANRTSNNLTYTVEPAVYTVDDATGLATGVTSTTTTAVPGTDANDEESWATQGLLEMRTGHFIGGREVRGRIFIPGPTSVSGSGGNPVAAYQTQLSAAGAALIADANSIWLAYSRKNATSVSVTVANSWTKWAVLRSRRD